MNEELLKIKDTDPEAERLLIENNMGLVYAAAKKFSNRGVETEDLIQIGSMGLIKAVRKFDNSFDVKFSTYAVPVIIGEIKRYLRDDSPIKVSRSLKELAMRGRAVSDALKKNGREPTLSEISAECGCSVEELSEAFSATTLPCSIYEETSDSSTMRLDKIPAPESEDAVINKIAVKEMLGELKPKERQVIILRYFRDMTQSAIAEVIGVSQVQVSRIEKKALAKIRTLAEM